MTKFPLPSPGKTSSEDKTAADPNDPSTSTTTNSPNANKTYLLNGRSIAIKTKATARTAIQAYYPKSERLNLSKKERMDLLDKIQAKQQRDLFKSITVSVNDPQKMTNTRSLAELLTEHKRNLVKYDLLDVYNIVFPLTDSFDDQASNYGLLRMRNGAPDQQNLFTHYLKLSVNDVAESSRWYSSFVDDIHTQEDLNWSLAYYEKNVESDLYSKVYAKMSTYPYNAQGGPLFLKILLDLVTTSSEGNLKVLETILDTYQIKKSSAGEDIELVVGLFTSIIETILALRNDDLPSDAVRKLLKIFQTTSVDDFNNQFDEMERSYVRTSIRAQLTEFNISATGEKGLSNDKNSAKYVLAYAERAYRDLLQSGEWDKCLQKAPGQSAFNATGQAIKFNDEHSTTNHNRDTACFNCGSKEHILRDCPHPRDPERIARNRAKHPTLGKSRRPYKWRVPEPQENNRRIIGGKPYTWNPNEGRSGRWILADTPSDGQPNDGQPPHTDNVTDNTAGSSGSLSQPQANLGQANSLNSTLRGLIIDSSSSSQSVDMSTLATQRTDTDPMERKLKLLMARAKIEDELRGL